MIDAPYLLFKPGHNAHESLLEFLGMATPVELKPPASILAHDITVRADDGCKFLLAHVMLEPEELPTTARLLTPGAEVMLPTLLFVQSLPLPDSSK
jgi:hypothetical protein